jgi:hypothetical protein
VDNVKDDVEIKSGYALKQRIQLWRWPTAPSVVLAIFEALSANLWRRSKVLLHDALMFQDNMQPKIEYFLRHQNISVGLGRRTVTMLTTI